MFITKLSTNPLLLSPVAKIIDISEVGSFVILSITALKIGLGLGLGIIVIHMERATDD